MTKTAAFGLFVTALLTGCKSDSAGEDSGVNSDSGTESDSYFPPRSCETRFSYASDAFGVFLAGDFNGWSDTELPMKKTGDRYEIEIALEPGAYAYKFVEKDGSVRWTCDPESELYHCDPGYEKATWNVCEPGANACNSMVVVGDCERPRLHILEVVTSESSAELELAFEPGASGAMLAQAEVEIDGVLQELEWDGSATYRLELSGLNPGRHAVVLRATDDNSRETEELSVPFWNDGSDGMEGLLYFPMTDRFANAQAENDWSEGTLSESSDYRGGDWKGIEEKLDSLVELGVRSLWLTAPQDNPSGAWGDKCGTDYSGYHGYWPTSVSDFEEHFGGEEDFVSLVEAAHDRGLRVIVDWVGNHVHEDHPYLEDHPEWFASQPLICQDANNWNDYPETCWFDPFLPDINYSQLPALDRMIEDAVAFARKYNIDGYRVDAVKHMPMAVVHNLVSELENALEHPGAPFEFYTLGETFDGSRQTVAAYVGDGMLDGQFDFPLYFSLRDAMFSGSTTLEDLEGALSESQAVYGTARMSTFLGNHDVARFVTEAAEGYHGECDPNGNFWTPAAPPEGTDAYTRLRLGWTWLLTRPGLPLVYYGDEIGLPGYADPDNRQLMRFEDELSVEEAATRAHVQLLGQARLAHPALAAEEGTLWWSEARVLARATQSGESWALSILNLEEQERTISNGLSWAGMPEGEWRDVLSGERFVAAEDGLSVPMPAMSSRVLVWEG
ncbi:MAG: alpha-amylase family glycosyl hydrolase [Myxococcota bacterium]|nr:alpha-amylase family glycosyl hydrolase [Myxococcota bacterium]